MESSVNKIVSKIVELSLSINSGNETRDIYSASLMVDEEVGKIMCQILEQERANEFNARLIPKIT